MRGRHSAPTCKRGLSDKVRKAPEATPAHPLPRSSYIDSFLLHPSHPNTPSLPPSPPLSCTLLSKSISRSLHYRSLGHRLLHLWGENVCILCLCVVSAVGERGLGRGGGGVCWGDRETWFMGRCQRPFAFLSASHLRLAAESPASPSSLQPTLPASPRSASEKHKR